MSRIMSPVRKEFKPGGLPMPDCDHGPPVPGFEESQGSMILEVISPCPIRREGIRRPGETRGGLMTVSLSLNSRPARNAGSQKRRIGYVPIAAVIKDGPSLKSKKPKGKPNQ